MSSYDTRNRERFAGAPVDDSPTPDAYDGGCMIKHGYHPPNSRGKVGYPLAEWPLGASMAPCTSTAVVTVGQS